MTDDTEQRGSSKFKYQNRKQKDYQIGRILKNILLQIQ